MEVIQLLCQANRELGRLDMYSKYIPNINLFINIHVTKEATQSNKIEGTQTNIQEALLEKGDLPLDKRDDWEEVQNYIEAMNEAIDKLEGLPFSAKLIKDIHSILLKGVRGQTKQPGEFRKSQNWIGGTTIDNATFIPPVHTSVPDLVSDIEKFVNNEKIYVPELLKIGLVHYQFETVHPFLDGNGRIGRLLIPLYLINKGILQEPILYLSDFFEKNRRLYYDKLMVVRDENKLSEWLKFFLQGIIETSKTEIETFDNILQLQKEVERDLQSLGKRAAKAKKVIDYLYRQPVISAKKVKVVAGVSTQYSYNIISDLEKLNILKEITGAPRKRLYIFKQYLDLFI